MIADDLQYRVTLRAVADFETALSTLDVDAEHRPAWIRQALRAAIRSELADLRRELAEYEAVGGRSAEL